MLMDSCGLNYNDPSVLSRHDIFRVIRVMAVL
jgi:hypothetical protein